MFIRLKLYQLYANPKVIQQIELSGQLKTPGSEIVTNESTFVLTILEKIKETRLKISTLIVL